MQCTCVRGCARVQTIASLGRSTAVNHETTVFYEAGFHRFSVSKMNEEAKRSMAEWQEKLHKVTKDSEERIFELQQKLAKVRKHIQQLKHAEFVGCF